MKGAEDLGCVRRYTKLVFNPWLIRVVLALSYGDPELKRFGAPIRSAYSVSKIVGIGPEQVARMRRRYVTGDIVDRRKKEHRNGPHWT